MARRDIDERIAELAEQQHGLVTRTQALDLGLTAHAIQSRRRSGRWRTVETGVYLMRGAPKTWHTDVLALCFAHDGVASHRTAAALRRLDGFRPGIIEISVPYGRSVHRAGVVIHESTDLHLFEPIIIDGIPTTPPARLAVDLGSVVSFRRFDLAVDEMLRDKLVTWEGLLDQLIQHSRKGRNGVGVLRKLLEERFGEDVGDSTLEGAFMRELRRRRLPMPDGQVKIYDRNGQYIVRVDYAYTRKRIAIELDSRKHHGDPAFESDREKRDRLVVEGWAVQEITWKRLSRNAHVVFDRLERLLEERPDYPPRGPISTSHAP